MPPSLPNVNDEAPSPADVERVVTRLTDHAPSVQDTTATQRKRKLRRLAEALRDRRGAIADALAADFRKASAEVTLTEIKPVLQEIDLALDHLEEWMAPDRISSSVLFTGTHSEIHYEPKGVVLILAPWNYPITLTLGPLVSAIAAGNCAVVKPSEHAPRTAAFLEELLHDLYDTREVAPLTGGPDVAQTLTEQPFDHIYFTGSPTVGREVMRAAADHLTSVTLELGGKSPALVDETADLDHAAERIAWSKFTNAGQTCIAPDYLLVEERVRDALVDRLRDTLQQFYGSTPEIQQASADYARLIHGGHYDRIVDLLDDARRAGATVAAGGHTHAETNYVAPTLLTDVPLDAAIMKEEIFGPLLPIRSYQTLDEALDVINERAAPLSLYLFTERESTVDTVLTRTTAGSTCVNEGFLHFGNPRLPFGGTGESGMGRGHGYRGFREFSNERSVLRRTYGSDLLRPLFPPYDGLTSRLTDWVLRFF